MELARALNVSLRQLERAFLHDTGWSPLEWLNQARHWHACSLLVERLTPKQIYADLGFRTAPGFFHAFKSYHGWTTREFLLRGDEIPSGGLARLKANRRFQAAWTARDGAPRHLAVLETLDHLLLRSPHFQLYLIRSRCRRPTPGVGP